MRRTALFLLLTAPALAQKPRTHHSWTPTPIATFADWQAATHPEGGVTVCYAFTYAKTSTPALHWRGHVVLTLAERPGSRDAIAVTLGYQVLPHAGATVTANGRKLPFYLEGRSAFAEHGQAVLAAFADGREAIGVFPGPNATNYTDVFSLKGFASARAAVEKACPAPTGPP